MKVERKQHIISQKYYIKIDQKVTQLKSLTSADLDDYLYPVALHAHY